MRYQEKFQLINGSKPFQADRKDHLWHLRGNSYLCLLCGAVTMKPPSYPTPNNWMPDKYEALTDEDRELARKYK